MIEAEAGAVTYADWLREHLMVTHGFDAGDFEQYAREQPWGNPGLHRSDHDLGWEPHVHVGPMSVIVRQPGDIFDGHTGGVLYPGDLHVSGWVTVRLAGPDNEGQQYPRGGITRYYDPAHLEVVG